MSRYVQLIGAMVIFTAQQLEHWPTTWQRTASSSAKKESTTQWQHTVALTTWSGKCTKYLVVSLRIGHGRCVSAFTAKQDMSDDNSSSSSSSKKNENSTNVTKHMTMYIGTHTRNSNKMSRKNTAAFFVSHRVLTSNFSNALNTCWFGWEDNSNIIVNQSHSITS